MSDFLKNMMTGRDNKTHDPIKVALTLITLSLPLILVWGLGLYTYFTIRPAPTGATAFVLRDFFDGTASFLDRVSLFFGGTAIALLIKRSTEPDGNSTPAASSVAAAPPVEVQTTTTINGAQK